MASDRWPTVAVTIAYSFLLLPGGGPEVDQTLSHGIIPCKPSVLLPRYLLSDAAVRHPGKRRLEASNEGKMKIRSDVTLPITDRVSHSVPNNLGMRYPKSL